MTTIEGDVRPGAALSLLSAAAVRARSEQIHAAGLAGDLRHFSVDEGRLDGAAAYVVDTIRRAYPDLSIPVHSRWRHFAVAGRDRWRDLAAGLAVDAREMARIRVDLAVTSVLLDAGAGEAWSYRDDTTGIVLERSEGLAIASLEAFAAGAFSGHPDCPLRADAAGLAAVTADSLGAHFQVSADNPLEGLEGRARLMNGLASALRSDPVRFGPGVPRAGNLVDHLMERHPHGLSAAALLGIVLDAFGGVWPGRLSLDGVSLGDTWRHPAVVVGDASDGLVPFHKLSQWLVYSLIEPLGDAGIPVCDPGGLTGLAEYRNGGLFIDTGVLAPRDPGVGTRRFAPGDEIIVEWRALTVALLDRVAERIRYTLDRTPEDLPLVRILQGGTWAAGRRIAAEKRAGGPPPIQVGGDGSVF